LMMLETSASAIASEVASGKKSAAAVVEETLARIAELNPKVNAFTAITPERALAKARQVDAAREGGQKLGPLAGVPFAVKDLFDVKGIATLAGSKINQDLPPATRDAVLVERLEAAGAVLVGALNMGEYAYDFTGENIHYGPSRNPHDLSRMSGGSSGGSGAAAGAELVPIALGSDTNGSIRVPSSFCGVFGLKPTYGRLPRTRTFPFVASLDHLGPFARNLRDLALAYDVMQGPDEEDPVCAARGVEPVLQALDGGIGRLRIVKAGGYFRKGASTEVLAAFDMVAEALDATMEIELPEVQRARGAAFLITASEGAALHLGRLRTRASDFDPAVRDRLLAGAMIPGSLIAKAQKFRRWYQAEMRKIFESVDAIIAPATPCTAPLIGETVLELDGSKVPLRANIGIYTQPISFIGLPVVAVPVPLKPLPAGVQIIAPAWREDIAFSIAADLERRGVVAAMAPSLR
jgi:aspartyl-tRNA(Asn)/glutamyl-tRNA(Gln) amidotransferase subunit A